MTKPPLLLLSILLPTPLHSMPHHNLPRLLQSPPIPGEKHNCDVSFMNCVPDQTCIDCYMALVNHDVAWATVTSETPCTDVLDVLAKSEMCQELRGNGKAQDTFCKVFDDCVIWDEGEDHKNTQGGRYDTDDDLDCSALTKCEFEGFHQSFLGDGICHRIGCYNSEICGYDGGDCCEDTCDNSKNDYAECGDEHYYCIDPKSQNCDPYLRDPELEPKCPSYNKTKPEVICPADHSKFHLNMYDSFGDGWGRTKIKIFENEGSNPEVAFSGGLKSGAEGIEDICLKQGCWAVETNGGAWSEEATWEIKQAAMKGGPPVAEGSAPAKCTFSVGGDACETTCRKYSFDDDMDYDDDEFDSFGDLEECINDKCMIQQEMCMNEPECAPCLNDKIPVYCFTNDRYNVLSRCTLCHCVDDERDCLDDVDDDDVPAAANNVVVNQCTGEQTLKGSEAIFKYSECSDIESTKAMMSDWDENAFGGLDTFEACSHTYNNDYGHGGKDPMDCMKILVHILDAGSTEKPAVIDIAQNIYLNGERFCDCAAESNNIAPMCQSFMNFKTLLHESLDACVALDEIDCAAWSQFATPCRENVINKFNSITFSNSEQCDYIQNGCGGVGPFPAFRRLDCGHEISKSAWDFYESFHKGCVGDVEPFNPPPITPQSPVSPPTPASAPIVNPDVKPPTVPYIPEPTPPAPKPYVPVEKKKKTSHGFMIFMTFVLGCGGYLVYKRRTQPFDVPYGRYRTMVGDDANLYGGLFDSTTSSFEPPTLPDMS